MPLALATLRSTTNWPIWMEAASWWPMLLRVAVASRSGSVTPSGRCSWSRPTTDVPVESGMSMRCGTSDPSCECGETCASATRWRSKPPSPAGVPSDGKTWMTASVAPLEFEDALERRVDDDVDAQLALDGGRYGIDGRQLAVLPDELPLRRFDRPEHDEREGHDPADRRRGEREVAHVVRAVALHEGEAERFQGEDEADREDHPEPPQPMDLIRHEGAPLELSLLQPEPPGRGSPAGG